MEEERVTEVSGMAATDGGENVISSARAGINMEKEEHVVIPEKDDMGLDSNNNPVVAGNEKENDEQEIGE